MEHDTMRLEPPVLNIIPKILFEDENIIVVDKPPSMLVHPGAGSNFTTVNKFSYLWYIIIFNKLF